MLGRGRRLRRGLGRGRGRGRRRARGARARAPRGGGAHLAPVEDGVAAPLPRRAAPLQRACGESSVSGVRLARGGPGRSRGLTCGGGGAQARGGGGRQVQRAQRRQDVAQVAVAQRVPRATCNKAGSEGGRARGAAPRRRLAAHPGRRGAGTAPAARATARSR